MNTACVACGLTDCECTAWDQAVVIYGGMLRRRYRLDVIRGEIQRLETERFATAKEIEDLRVRFISLSEVAAEEAQIANE